MQQAHSFHTKAVVYPSSFPTVTLLATACSSARNSAPTGTVERDRLIQEHLITVRTVARALHARMPRSVDLEELISAGYVGLVDAATKFDGARQVQFKTYAQIRIRGAILDSVRSLDWSPRDLRRQGRVLRETMHGLATRLGRSPDDAEIAAAMNMDLRSLQQLTADLKGLEVRSLNEDRSEDIEEEEVAYVAAPSKDSPLERCMVGQTREQLEAAFAKLSERERLILKLYYFEELTLKEIGLTLGVVESRISQLRLTAIAHLRRHLKLALEGQRSTKLITRAFSKSE